MLILTLVSFSSLSSFCPRPHQDNLVFTSILALIRLDSAEGANFVPRVLRLLGQRAAPGETLGSWKNVIFLIGCSELFRVTKLRTVNSRIPTVTTPLSQSLSLRRPLTKKPENSGYEIERAHEKAETWIERAEGDWGRGASPPVSSRFFLAPVSPRC